MWAKNDKEVSKYNSHPAVLLYNCGLETFRDFFSFFSGHEKFFVLFFIFHISDKHKL